MIFKKPKFWDLKKPNLLAYFLSPFTFPVRINNLFLDRKSKKIDFKLKSICVGNIYLGGTGKTPATIKLFNILKDIFPKICTGKKYYSSQYDEQILLKNKTNLICEHSRKKIINKAIDTKIEMIIFDDGLQDKTINYDLQIVCFDKKNWVGNGYILPAGPLREKLDSLKKYDIVFLKGENFDTNVEELKSLIKKQNPQIEIFQTYYEPSNLIKFKPSDKFLIFSGIGNPDGFREILELNKINIVKEIIFPDHNTYNDKDVKKIKDMAKNLNAKIITTEKDYIKLSEKNCLDINFLEIDLKIKDEKRLINFIKSKINE